MEKRGPGGFTPTICLVACADNRAAGLPPLAVKNGESHRLQAATWLEPVSALVKPVSAGPFAGALSISRIPSWADRLKFRLNVMLGVWSEGDHRDWSAIRGRAAGLLPLLQ